MLAIVLAAALASATIPPDTVPDAADLAGVQALYDQSCQERAYGSYDDLCNALKQQLRQAQQAERKAQRAAARPPPRPAAAVTTPVAANVPAAPAGPEPASAAN